MSSTTLNGRANVQRASVYDSTHLQTTSSKVLLIHQLAGQGDVNSLRQEINKDPDLLEARDSEGTTPLFKAVSQAHLECVQYLATSGANVDAKDNIGRTPLAAASYQGWRDGVYYLLAMEANCLLSDNNGRLPHHAAASCSNKDALEVLLQYVPDDAIGKQDNEGMTALHWASFHGHADHIGLLISKGADVVTRDNEGKMPIHWAAQNGYESCCQAMIHLADSHTLVNGKDYSGKTPIHLAAAAGSFQVLMDLATVDFANIKTTDRESRTPLHFAAMNGRSRCVALLLRLGAEKEAEDRDGVKALRYAQQSGHSECCQILLAHDPNDPLKTEIPPDEGSRKESETLKQSNSEVINLIPTLGTVEVHVNMDEQDGVDLESGEVASLLHGFRNWNSDFLHASMNGMHGDGEMAYSSDDESRYPPQMVLTPVPSSPVPPEESSEDDGARPSLLPRFSLGDQAALDLKHPTPAPSSLAPLKSKTIPEHLRLDISFSSGTVKAVEMKPPSPSEASLAPLKVLKSKSPLVVLPREGTGDSDVSKQWARKAKKQCDGEVETPRRTRERKTSSGNSSQMLPVIYTEKTSHVTQIQGTRQDQLEASKKNRRKLLKNRSVSDEFTAETTQMEETDEGFEDGARPLRNIEAAKDKKKKKKVKKVMSWNV